MSSDGRRRWRGLLCFFWAFVAVGVAIASWSLATPPGAAPDEPSQVIQATALVRGQFDQPEHHSQPGNLATVQVPTWAVGLGVVPDCFVFHPEISAGCAPALTNDSRQATGQTQFSNYPPLYFALVGLPSLAFDGVKGVLSMRFASVVLNGALLALGLYLLARYHPRRLPLVGALVALSPMVLFITSVVNASGLETTAGFAAWCGGVCVVELDEVPRMLAALTALSFAVLVLTRPISPLYAVVVIGVLALLAGRRRIVALSRDRSVRLAGLAVVGAVVVAGVLLGIGGTPSLLGFPHKPRLSTSGEIAFTLRLTGQRLLQCIGDFGWLDTPAPAFTLAVWSTAVAALVGFAITVSSSCRRALPVLVVAVLAMPVLFESPKIDAIGPYWQGRYWLPLLVGVPLVAATAWKGGHHRRAWSSTWSVAGVIAGGAVLVAAQVAAFLTALHRNETGLGARRGPPSIGRRRAGRPCW